MEGLRRKFTGGLRHQKRFAFVVLAYRLHLANTTCFFKSCLFTWIVSSVSHRLSISRVCVVLKFVGDAEV